MLKDYKRSLVGIMEKDRVKYFVILQLLMMILSITGVFSKLAAGRPFMSSGFLICYGMVFVITGIYAVGWQQVIKRLPLSVAFANKAVTVLWGMLWGLIFFSERVTPGRIAGAVLVMAGVMLMAGSREGQESGTEGREG